jgi:hypothetical protein
VHRRALRNQGNTPQGRGEARRREQGLDTAREGKAIESAANELAKIVQEHRRAWLGIQQILKDSIRAVQDLNWQPPGWASMLDRDGKPIEFDSKCRIAYAKDMAALYCMLADGLITS